DRQPVHYRQGRKPAAGVDVQEPRKSIQRGSRHSCGFL
ncbi:MAG: hypothetical protein AVDCRST_MAG68-555, partial [uncultured Gemmatimonadetes bacterium]